MNNLIAELEEASQEIGPNSCKICSYLTAISAVDGDEAVKVDNLIRAKIRDKNKISAEKVAGLLRKHGADVGATTVRRHRTTCAPFQPIREL